MLQTLYYLLFIPLVKIFHTSKCRLAPQECMSEFIVGKSNNADAAIKDDDRDGSSRNNRNRSHMCTSNALNQLKQVKKSGQHRQCGNQWVSHTTKTNPALGLQSSHSSCQG